MSFRKIICFLVSLVLAVSNSYGAIIQEKPIENEPIDSGFFFWDGKYIEAPYRIESRDLLVFINGFQVTQYPYIRPSLIVTEDPGIPPGVTRETGLDGLDKIKWEGRIPHTSAKLAYLWKKYSKEEARERMIDYYRSLPCIKEAVRVEGYKGIVRLTDYHGNSRNVGFDIDERSLQPPPTEEELQELINKRAAMYKERFREGDCLLFFKKGAELSITGRDTVNILREMREILLDDTKDSSAKINELLTLDFILPDNSELAEQVVLNFAPNERFDEHLKALEQKMIAAYGPEAIHPVERNLFLKSQQEKERRFLESQRSKSG